MDKNTIIETLDYLFEKFGIAVDWTTENVMPYVEQLAEKIVTYKIVTDSLWILISLVTVIICCIFVKKLYTDYKLCVAKKENGTFWEWYDFGGNWDLSTLGFIHCVVITVAFIIAFILLIGCSAGLLKWIFIPELQLVEYVSNLVSILGA